MSVRLWRLNRPEKYNALTLEMIEELSSVLLAQDGIRVLLLRGEGQNFCSGADLKGDIPKIFEALANLYHSMVTSPKIIIALIDGYCLAGGFGLAAAADLALATPEATFQLPETRRGLLAPLATLLAENALPQRLLKELALSGVPLPASRLYEVGFLNQIVPRDNLEAAGQMLAQNILKGAPQATQLTKYMLAKTPHLLEHALAWQKKALATHELDEGLAAFQQKRPPNWFVH